MFAWLFKRFRSHKVMLPNSLKLVARKDFNEVVPSKELGLWLAEYPGQYRLDYDRISGKCWLEFNNEQSAVLCRLTFN